MAYQKAYSPDNPGLIVFLVDQSAAMSECMDESPARTIADAAAAATNAAISEVIARCVKGPGQVSNRCQMALMGYGGAAVRSAWGGELTGRRILGAQEVASSPLRFDRVVRAYVDGRGGILHSKFDEPVWIDPAGAGITSLNRALAEAVELLRGWVTYNMDSFPPVVIHVGSGRAMDGDPLVEAHRLRACGTRHGHALFANVTFSLTGAYGLVFPVRPSELRAPFGRERLMYEMSSEVPGELLEFCHPCARAGARMMAVGEHAREVVQMLPFSVDYFLTESSS